MYSYKSIPTHDTIVFIDKTQFLKKSEIMPIFYTIFDGNVIFGEKIQNVVITTSLRR